MRQFVFSLIACLVGLSAHADERFLPHIKWITENSDLEYNGEPLPTIEYVSAGELLILAHGPEAVAKAEYEGREMVAVLASYHDYVVYLQSEEVFEQEPWIVVHELVHYLQDVNGTTKECIPANEPEAYRLHDKWQEQHGYPRNPGNVFYGILLGMACEENHRYVTGYR